MTNESFTKETDVGSFGRLRPAKPPGNSKVSMAALLIKQLQGHGGIGGPEYLPIKLSSQCVHGNRDVSTVDALTVYRDAEFIALRVCVQRWAVPPATSLPAMGVIRYANGRAKTIADLHVFLKVLDSLRVFPTLFL